MRKIEIKMISITDLKTDAIVNAANSGLWPGGGVCGAIFKAAGCKDLEKACKKIGHCDAGNAVITPGFASNAKYIIHAVGPQWKGENHNEPELLYKAYQRSLELAVQNKCRSIGFPLISAGIYGYPMQKAWEQAIKACCDFLKSNTDADIYIVFAVLDKKTFSAGNECLNEWGSKDLNAEQPVIFNSEKHHDTLKIGGQTACAVFFHKPEEPHGYLSNWYPSPFDLDGMRFTSTEQYIMYRKCMAFGDEKSAAAVMTTNDPAKQQEIGRYAENYIDSAWKAMRQSVATVGLLEKFRQNEELRNKQLDTGDAYLVECAHLDKAWACGRGLDENERFDASLWTGSNILGFALMEVRNMIRSEYDPK